MTTRISTALIDVPMKSQPDTVMEGLRPHGYGDVAGPRGQEAVRVGASASADGPSGAIARAEELVAQTPGAWMPQQFENPANPAYHRSTTGPEILSDFAGRKLDFWVTGWGTGGTLTGVGEVLKVARPQTKIITTEPAGASLLSGKDWAPHKIQGWTPDFIPAVLNQNIANEIIPVDDVLARDTARRLAAEEGVFVGISAGATLAAALRVAEKAEPGSVILAMLPDTGERYLSTFLFEGVSEGSDDEWLAEFEAKTLAA